MKSFNIEVMLGVPASTAEEALRLIADLIETCDEYEVKSITMRLKDTWH